jgi:hypothetical protein
LQDAIFLPPTALCRGTYFPNTHLLPKIHSAVSQVKPQRFLSRHAEDAAALLAA